MIFAGERLTNFKIMIGNDFESDETDTTAIRTWSECVHVPGKKLLHSFVLVAWIETCYKYRQ